MKYEDFTEKMLLAFEDTVEAYEILIETLENGTSEEKCKIREKWVEYGTTTNCRLCKVAGATEDSVKCSKCVLGNGQDVHRIKTFPCGVDKSGFNNLVNKLSRFHSRPDMLIEAAKDRLKWLLKRAEENDVVLK